MKTAIVTDTNSGIFPDRGKQLGIYVVPMPIIIHQKTYYEGRDLTPEQFYRVLEDGRDVYSSQPPLNSLLTLWDAVLEQNDELVYIPMSSGLSSSCTVAQGVSREYDGKVQVVDNHRISAALESSVLDAKALADAGCTAREIKENLEHSAYDTITYVGVETLEYLKRSGRVTAAGAALSTLLNIRPLLKIQGEKLDAYAKIRGRENCQKRLVAAIQEHIEGYLGLGWEFRVAAADSSCNPTTRNEWITFVSTQLEGHKIGYAPLTCSIGCHVGADAFGMAISRKII